MLSLQIGNVAISKAGHDKGSRYLIVKIEKDFAYLVDGKLRKLDKPKKKNIKHIQNLYIDDNSIKDKIVNGISDEEIKYFVKTLGGKNV